ncbi:uncharacterized protein I303_104906 [Kwoniella dejecticola CBS 10117]|uniref:Uncharacterized protein n=1 Tax=Kwoniella dejecticola CBS 10117 TaxID=1296121 RepID=A0A1A6A410_9TREE|nr:uncharacterized protein I303_05648 [Kwoniella dejecticola CBS 10117]OBR84789.1 hypothetical protein I303_05648 [Kwoniella dejecticola CBS 10117]
MLVLILLLPGFAAFQAIAQKINQPQVSCSSLNKCNCEFICKTYPTNADEQFGQTGSSLIELQCTDGITSNGYEALGKDLVICMNCIRAGKPGARTSSQLIYWSNICDKAWSTSTPSAVDALGQSRDDVSEYFLFDRATLPHHATALRPATVRPPADDGDDIARPTAGGSIDAGATVAPATTHAVEEEEILTGGDSNTIT